MVWLVTNTNGDGRITNLVGAATGGFPGQLHDDGFKKGHQDLLTWAGVGANLDHQGSMLGLIWEVIGQRKTALNTGVEAITSHHVFMMKIRLASRKQVSFR